MQGLAFASLILLFNAAACQSGYDIILQNGRIVDGSGNPWYVSDIGIRNGRVVAIGRLKTAKARRMIDAKGMVVAPGFIDAHTHVESTIRRLPTAQNFLLDGVTSIITGNCGSSETELGKWFRELRQMGLSVNLGTLIGHNSVRSRVMGTVDRGPTSLELATMGELVERAMNEGAFGLSTGLIYVPGSYSKTLEIVSLARAAAKHNGVYASHIRNEGDQVFAGIAEAIQIGRESGIPVEISHFKVSSKPLWGQSVRTIQMVMQARSEGLDVTVDQYPYTASSTTLTVLLPSWAEGGGQAEINKRLADPVMRKRIVTEMQETIQKRNGHQHMDYAVVARCHWDHRLEGKSITQINKEAGRKETLENEIEVILEMLEKNGAWMVYHTMDEGDVERILRFPYSMVASDGGLVEFGVGVPHPRSYGTNARVLGHYVREKKTILLEEAIRKMTSLPAQRFGLVDRGLLRPGMWADLVVFDEKTVADKASFEKPHCYNEGFHYVLVNGQVVIDQGQFTGARPGQILVGPGVPRWVLERRQLEDAWLSFRRRFHVDMFL